jgi:hypothetical protein
VVEDTDKGKPRESGGRKANGTDGPRVIGGTSLPGCRSNLELFMASEGADVSRREGGVGDGPGNGLAVTCVARRVAAGDR